VNPVSSLNGHQHIFIGFIYGVGCATYIESDPK